MLDPDTNDPIAAHVYIDGVFAGALDRQRQPPRRRRGAAVRTEPRVQRQLHRAVHGQHSVCVYGIGVGQGGNNRLPCKNVSVG